MRFAEERSDFDDGAWSVLSRTHKYKRARNRVGEKSCVERKCRLGNPEGQILVFLVTALGTVFCGREGRRSFSWVGAGEDGKHGKKTTTTVECRRSALESNITVKTERFLFVCVDSHQLLRLRLRNERD